MLVSRIGPTAGNHITMVSGPDGSQEPVCGEKGRRSWREHTEYDAVESRETGTYRAHGGWVQRPNSLTIMTLNI